LNGLATNQNGKRALAQRQVVNGRVGPVEVELVGVGLRQLGRRVERAVDAEGLEKLLVIGDAERDAVCKAHHAGPRVTIAEAIAGGAHLSGFAVRKVGVGADFHVLRQRASHARA
nr:hypothetical protein [Tanacetum cinerariifolium]